MYLEMDYSGTDIQLADLSQYRRQAIKAAEDFKYGRKVENALKAAKTEREITRIMATARKKRFDKEFE